TLDAAGYVAGEVNGRAGEGMAVHGAPSLFVDQRTTSHPRPEPASQERAALRGGETPGLVSGMRPATWAAEARAMRPTTTIPGRKPKASASAPARRAPKA